MHMHGFPFLLTRTTQFGLVVRTKTSDDGERLGAFSISHGRNILYTLCATQAKRKNRQATCL